jgi:glycosyltransferase involved in cell wall biosynthesis
MKFAIITHVQHKLNKQHIFAYEPYVREMNLWLKYVGEVQIVAPVASEEVTSIESNYEILKEEIATSHTSCNDGNEQNEQIATSHTPRNDGNEQNEQIATSHTPRNDERECHPEPVEGFCNTNENRENIKSIRQAQTDNGETERHSQLDWESHDLGIEQKIPHQVRDDGKKKINLIKISSFDVTSFKNGIVALFKIPIICYRIYKTMQWADHIHLRCPGNIGLLGCFVQILFPNKPKTVKYAGNWDPKSKQPFSYKLQKWLVSNTFLTKNAKVLVYGEWPNQSKNIVSFFTASYSEKEIEEVDMEVKVKSLRQVQTDKTKRHNEQGKAISSKGQIATSHTPCNDEQKEEEQIATLHTSRNDEEERHSEQREAISSLMEQILSRNEERICHSQTKRHSQLDWESHQDILNFIFVGGLTIGKQPLLSVQVVHELKKSGYKVHIDIYGEGEQRAAIEKYCVKNNLEKEVTIHGNTSKELVKKAYQKAHFLLFLSKSEGWPKVVTEAMFWGCLPISSNVSCIPFMLGNGSRGAIANPNINEIVSVVESYIRHNEKYQIQVKEAMEWSRQYTLEKFEKEIGKLLYTSFPD